MKSSSKHWNLIFSGAEDSKLGWYEKDAEKTFELLNQVPNLKDLTVFLPGAGTSILIEQLIAKGAKLVLNDISIEALNKVKGRLQVDSDKIYWLCQDISKPITDAIPNVDIWIDRAVLHFLTREEDIKGYFNNLESKLKVGSYAIFAEFSKTGAPKCAGLTVHRYSIEELSERLSSSFKLITSFNHTYINPNGDPRPYIYGLYKRTT
ncbi:methyltransferase domain-containing protein [Neptunomonas antarctica]|uniref:Nodulation protein S (NodS) n=1 Tax=Neptunomonas antarctica TaxID=619304 RepID=A0A1N7PB96_9GAMM|nr:class I SAM-dependent methyltransferase [Neptunomonas antarctica]SIT07903.1 Nodulation protein S (NodS) [Neptunomonas antarctica]